MREYELTVIYDLSVAEAGGQQAAVDRLTASVAARGGELIKVDHWGRRRMAYPINAAIDGDYVVTRVNLEPSAVSALEAALKIDERVYRHLLVRADELPAPAPPREPRAPRRTADDAPVGEAPAAAAPAATEAPAAAAPAAATDAPAAATEAPAPAAAAAPAEEAPAPEAASEAPAAEPATAAEAPTETTAADTAEESETPAE